MKYFLKEQKEREREKERKRVEEKPLKKYFNIPQNYYCKSNIKQMYLILMLAAFGN